MLVVNNGRVEFEMAHLEENKITEYKGILERYAKVDCTLFYHVVSSPECGYEAKFGKGRIPADFATMQAKDRLYNILKTKKIIGNPKSYFVDKSAGGGQPLSIEEIKSVSFALANLNEVPRHFAARKSEYTLVFFHDFLQRKGLQEVIYLNNIQDPADKKRIIFNSPHLLEIFVKYYDNRWEREWRISKELVFEDTDVAFIVVPDDDFDEFEHWTVHNDFETRVVPSSLYTNSMNFLKAIDQVQPGWNGQVDLGGGEGKFKVDFDEFPPYTDADREELAEKCSQDLDALCKSFLMEIYEHAYIERFLRFASKLDKGDLAKLGFDNLENFRANQAEPWHSTVDLVKGLYGQLLHIQSDRIDFGV